MVRKTPTIILRFQMGMNRYAVKISSIFVTVFSVLKYYSSSSDGHYVVVFLLKNSNMIAIQIRELATKVVNFR